MRKTIFFAVMFALLFTIFASNLCYAQGLKRFTVYRDNNNPSRNSINEKKEAHIIRDVIKEITYFPNASIIILKESQTITLVVPTEETLKLNAGDVIEFICFYCRELLVTQEDENVPAYLAIRIDKLVSPNSTRFFTGSTSNIFLNGSINKITKAHNDKIPIKNPSSLVSISCHSQGKNNEFSTEYVLDRFDKFKSSLNKKVVLQIFSFAGDTFLRNIHDESIFQKLLNGEFPQEY